MAHKFSDGDYMAFAGSYAGLAYFKGKWHKYECGGCMRGLGLIRNRLSVADHHRIMNRFKTMTFEFRHTIETHKLFLAQKENRK